MNKKGLSHTVSIVLLILLSIAAVAILAFFIFYSLKDTSSQIEVISMHEALIIVDKSIWFNKIDKAFGFVVRRTNSPGQLIGFNVIAFDTDMKSLVFDKYNQTGLVPLQTKPVSIIYADSKLKKIKKIEVRAILQAEDGRIVQTRLPLVYTFNDNELIGNPTSCGNGLLNDGEECDNGNFNGYVCVPFTDEKTCNYCGEDCLLKTVTLPDEEAECGNSILEAGEQCEPALRPIISCKGYNSEKYTNGEADCIEAGKTGQCTYDVSSCVKNIVLWCNGADINQDGVVNADDYFIIDQGSIKYKGIECTLDNNLCGIEVDGKTWSADINQDGVVNADDYFIIDSWNGESCLIS